MSKLTFLWLQHYKHLLLAAALVALSGCATMSKQECQVADWFVIGQGDAEKGYPKLRLDEHRQACAKAGVAPDLYQYEAGHKRGLKTYCTTHNGYAVGVNGGNYQGVCQGFAGEDFLRGYRDGRELYVARSNVARVNDDIRSYDSEIERIHRDTADYQRRLVSGDTSPQQRYDYISRIKEMQRNLGHLENNLREALRERFEVERELHAVEQKHQGFRY